MHYDTARVCSSVVRNSLSVSAAPHFSLTFLFGFRLLLSCRVRLWQRAARPRWQKLTGHKSRVWQRRVRQGTGSALSRSGICRCSCETECASVPWRIIMALFLETTTNLLAERPNSPTSRVGFHLKYTKFTSHLFYSLHAQLQFNSYSKTMLSIKRVLPNMTAPLRMAPLPTGTTPPCCCCCCCPSSRSNNSSGSFMAM